jgi:hypothetical protein
VRARCCREWPEYDPGYYGVFLRDLHGSVFAGAKRAGDGSLVSGGVWVYLGPVDVSSTAPTTDAGMFLARSGPTELTIVSAHGQVLTLRDGHGQTLTFNLVTHKFN